MAGPTLAIYEAQVRSLLHDPNAQFYPTATLDTFINSARQQVATEGECLRGIGTLSTVASQAAYKNSDIVPPALLLASPILKLRSIRYLNAIGFSSLGSSDILLEPRPWDWFNFYWLTLGPHPPAPPRAWAPFQNGNDGSFYIGPQPDSVYPLAIDGVWLPVDLTGTTPDIIPAPWTEAVQYYAGYLAALDSQRYADADHMIELFELQMERARAGVTPSTTPNITPGGQNSRGRGSPGQSPPLLSNQPPSPPSQQGR